jgi:hypothetical protein
MTDITLITLSVVYTVLVLIVVSLDGTYNITHTLFGGFIGNPSQTEYGTGVKLISPGFIIHTLIFTLLILMPMLTCS